jgi:hypothetical protein
MIQVRMNTMRPLASLSVLGLTLFSTAIVGCGEPSGSVPEVPASELNAQVPELDAIHDVMVPLWHEAFPNEDYAAIQDLTPRFQDLLTALDEAQLPGILRDKQAEWDEGKLRLMEIYENLQIAVETGNQEDMLGFTEAFHMSYEGLVRIIRPVVPELDVVHQHLYGLYHYYGPGYDVEKIRQATDGMAAALPPLQAAQLPARLSDRQPEFDAAVNALATEVTALQDVLSSPDRESVEAAIEAVHTAYSRVEHLFD